MSGRDKPLWKLVKSVIDEADPMRLAGGGCPKFESGDEYNGEVDLIVERLHRCQDESHAALIIDAAFYEMFFPAYTVGGDWMNHAARAIAVELKLEER